MNVSLWKISLHVEKLHVRKEGWARILLPDKVLCVERAFSHEFPHLQSEIIQSKYTLPKYLRFAYKKVKSFLPSCLHQSPLFF